MNFYSIKTLPSSHGREAVFKVWPIPKILAAVIFSALSGLLIYLGSQGGYHSEKVNLSGTACYWVGGWLVLFAWIALNSARSSLGRTNWLMKARPGRLLIKYRSFHNHHFPEEDPVIVEILSGDVEWVREVDETMTAPSSDEGGDRTCHSTFLDLKLSPKLDLSQIKQALHTERKRKAPMKGFTSSKTLHYPVQFVEPGILRLEWQGIRPTIKQALRILRMQFSLNTGEIFKAKEWDQLEGQELEDHILDLAQRGRTLKATRLANLKLNLSTTEAVQFVEDLMEQTPK